MKNLSEKKLVEIIGGFVLTRLYLFEPDASIALLNLVKELIKSIIIFYHRH